jgi:pyruvate/2-oxoglutarate dehydrogenase complex dihydrolipoamide dehydrogenase (E3) component
VSFDYELLVIGSGPAGQKAAIQAAKLGRKVAVVEREQVRGVSVIGQAVMGFEGTVDYLVDAVFNYPTLAESYKVAALDARNKLLAVERLAR